MSVFYEQIHGDSTVYSSHIIHQINLNSRGIHRQNLQRCCAATKAAYNMYPKLCLVFCCFVLVSKKEVNGFYDIIGKCPIACTCTQSKENTSLWEVRCVDKHYWKKIPPLPENTTYLGIIGCDLQELKNGAFHKAGGDGLREMVLKTDNIFSIDPNAFQDLMNLEVLTLSGNKIGTLHKDTFVNTHSLSTITLDRNVVTKIPAESLCLVKKLSSLNLASNNLTSAKMDKCFSQLLNLVTLDLSNNPIRKIKPTDFVALKNVSITRLNLVDLKLTTLSKEVLENFPCLEQLNLAKNNFKFVPAEMFQYNSGLLYLTFEVNKLVTVPNSAIIHLRSLRSLELGHNKIKYIHLGSEFQHMPNLTSLTFSGNPITRLYNDSFSHLMNSGIFRQLFLKGCNIHTIEADTFLPLKYLQTLVLDRTQLNAHALEHAFFGLRNSNNLQSLNLDRTYLIQLTNNTFQYLANSAVTYLRARSTKITTIQAGTFRFFKKLETLDLADNRIYSIQPRAFENLHNLVRLDLTKNRLPYIPYANISHLKAVKILILKGNYIRGHLTEDLFQGYTQLEELSLVGNGVRSIGSNAFRHLPNLKRLDLSHNTMRSRAFTKYSFTGLKSIQTLSLASIAVIEFDSATFKFIPSLQVLDMSGNRNIEIQGGIDNMFHPLRNLTKLTMTSIGLEKIPENTFWNLTELKVIDLSKNGITKWHPDLFKDQENLQKLILANNKITSIDEKSLKNLKYLRELDISNNMFNCDCNLQWLPNFIRKRTVFMENADSVVCKSPPKKNKDKLMDLHMERECMTLTFYYAYWFLLFCHICTITWATVTYRLRWYLR